MVFDTTEGYGCYEPVREVMLMFDVGSGCWSFVLWLLDETICGFVLVLGLE
jgi:hypothetical protein